MKYIHGKLHLKRGGKINVSITRPTRILIMKEREYRKYKEGISFTYYGGQKDKEFEFSVPKTDSWHIVVEKGTYDNPVDVSANVSITHPVAPIRKKRKIASTLAEADAELDDAETAQPQDGDDESSEEEEEVKEE